MGLFEILVFGLIAAGLGLIRLPHIKVNAIALISLIAYYWIQPASPIRYLDFWLPTTALILCVLVYLVVQPRQLWQQRENLATVWLVLGVVLAAALLRYLPGACCLGDTTPPPIQIVAGFLLAWTLLAALQAVFGKVRGTTILFIGLLLIFLLIKNPALSLQTARQLRALNGQSATLASPVDIVWLGYSYLAFRLLHVLRDHRAGRLGEFTLPSFLAYVLFFPAIVAGPIDRIEHFVAELNRKAAPIMERLGSGLQRITVGLLFKFVLADSLALVSLSPTNAPQLNSTIWAWVMVYVYALRIFFDFAGYTEIAIGISALAGITLPENFARPYAQTGLTTFWNCWHITLTQWFRSYVFNPLTRYLRRLPRRLPSWLIILIGQLATMGLIGLWHGITLNFVIWGIWHALGLFIHNRWKEFSRRWQQGERNHLVPGWFSSAASWMLTFNFVALGWVWFALPDLGSAWDVLKLLFGVR